MGFGDAYINIQLITQGFLDPPVIYDKSEGRIVSNPKLSNKLKMYRWYIGNSFIASVNIFSAVRLGFLLKRFNAETASKAAKEEIFVYIFTVAITVQALCTWSSLERNSGWISGVEAQIFKAMSIDYRGINLNKLKY